MKRVKAGLLKITYFVLLFAIFPLPQAFAASDFEITNSYNVDYRKGNNYITITESVLLNVVTQDYYIPAGTTQSFIVQDYSLKELKGERAFKKETLKVINQYGTTDNYKIKDTKDGFEVEVPITSRVDYRSNYRMTIEYRTHELVNANGNIVNIYVPGLSEETKFQQQENGLTTTYTYLATVTTDKDLPLPSYLQPNTIKTTEKQNEIVYTIDQEDRLGHTSWLQLGSSQYYYFKIAQPAPKTDTVIPKEVSKISPIISSNVFKLALPREFDENKQKVYFKSITPEPKAIERDSEGNLIATFSVPANEESEIVIEGYITLFNSPISEGKPISDLSISEYRSVISEEEELKKYIKSDKYWETDSSIVKEVAEKLLKDESNVLQIITKDYRYVVDQFDYDFEKINSGNPRIGALKALSGGQTICMEYADSLIAILRAQGIAARAAMGYGNDPTGAENRISNDQALLQTIGHQWVQVWIPQYGWLSVDPTWGESEKIYIGSDLDHILWYTVGDNEQTSGETIVYSSSFIKTTDLEATEVYIQALDSNSEEEILNYKTSDMIIDRYEADDLTGISLFLQTTPFGRVIIFLLPIATVCAVTVLLTLSIKSLKKRLKPKN